MTPHSPPFFTEPNAECLPLRIRPRLDSWERGGHPDQVRLEEYLVHVQEIVQPRLERTPGPRVLRLDVVLPGSVPLLEHHDLDNYLFPLVKRISRDSGCHFASVWGTKSHAGTPRLCLDRARPATSRPVFGHTYEVSTTASAESPAYKEQIADQLGSAVPLRDGPVSLHLGFCVGPRRWWPNLWKPTIDALERILGGTTPTSRWHPRDGRIVQLGMHCRIDRSLGNDVVIRVDADPATVEGTT
ncbi:hypothetical protein LP52_12345 [Streptomonospora alba]|uniref:Uncharacterized protein n=1 Tax=Streptomonospora alba TaxID=183763 RepID=A0A0C2JP69_9ACTN|nr:hypothetical protein [Streptomonospora alba]KIH98607.1 hypothetical protein LP52_12345 [Streptomonospora alba]